MGINELRSAVQQRLNEKPLTLPELSRALRITHPGFTVIDLIVACRGLIQEGIVGELPREDFAPKMFLQIRGECE